MALTGPSKKLSLQHIKFVDEFCICLSATEAAKKANYSEKTSGQIGYQLLQNPLIQAAIERRRQEISANTGITPEKVIQALADRAFADIADCYNDQGNLKGIHDIPKSVRMAISSLESFELNVGFGEEKVKIGDTKQVKLSDKSKDLDALAKHFGLYNADNTNKSDLFAGVALERLISIATRGCNSGGQDSGEE
jgi:phage terminase small subunit